MKSRPPKNSGREGSETPDASQTLLDNLGEEWPHGSGGKDGDEPDWGTVLSLRHIGMELPGESQEIWGSRARL